MFIIASFICIRKQLFINENQFYTGMIPHHSMAVHMSKELIKKNENIRKFKDITNRELNYELISSDFAKSIIDNQNREIQWMKNQL